MRIIYQAKRHLAAGHTLDSSYEIYGGHEESLPVISQKGVEKVALSGATETDLWRIETEWRVTTDHISRAGSAPTEYDIFEEFIYSVMGGESFMFDPFSDLVGVDVAPRLVMMVSNSVQPRRTNPFRFKFSFNVKEI